MKKFKENVMAILAVIGVIAFSLPAESRERHKQIYSNVTVEDMDQLFRGVAFVSFQDAMNKKGHKNQHALSVRWLSKNGVSYFCNLKKDNEQVYTVYQGPYEFSFYNAKRHSEKYPLYKYGTSPKKGFRTVRYKASGETSFYILHKGYWWPDSVGHLQERLPAAVWTACPDFPSAASLGADVNQKQTSTNYMELLKQDRGQRIQRPDLITENTVERY